MGLKSDAWLLRHPRTAKGILILMLPLVPILGCWYGTRDIFDAWREDWFYIGVMNDHDN